MRKVGGSTPPLTASCRCICQPSHLREPQEERDSRGASIDRANCVGQAVYFLSMPELSHASAEVVIIALCH